MMRTKKRRMRLTIRMTKRSQGVIRRVGRSDEGLVAIVTVVAVGIATVKCEAASTPGAARVDVSWGNFTGNRGAVGSRSPAGGIGQSQRSTAPSLLCGEVCRRQARKWFACLAATSGPARPPAQPSNAAQWDFPLCLAPAAAEGTRPEITWIPGPRDSQSGP
mmetsp:Transcript_23117/g.37928  ORF Transcript_23117/g.37928 Transcript_23117/m.37928 type:complete len:162 (+) Transcript_23117:205-690(+)